MADEPIPDLGSTLEEDQHPEVGAPPVSEHPRNPGPETIEGPLTQQSLRAPPAELTSLPLVAKANYELGSEVARGGLGRIIRARDLRLNRIVAIKELLKETPSTRARFQREIEVTVRLQHPNIVAVHEAGQWPSGHLFYAMNFVVGETFLEAIQNTGTLDSRLALVANVIAIADAVAFAHDQGVIHRDLKPANVLVGRFGETVLIDWGLAKYTEQPEAEAATLDQTLPSRSGVTATGGVVGTPPYMPPEQARGEEATKQADVYSLGAILYHALSGIEPYHHYRDGELIEKIVGGPPMPVTELEPELAPDLVAILEKAMARDPEARYVDGAAMADELRRFAAGRLVGAYAYRPWDLAKRFIARHSAAFSTALVALTVLIVLAVSLVRRIREQRDIAEQNAHVAIQERDVATERSQALLISQARVQAETDPTQSVALLKDLPKERPGALSVAARAAELGVARRILRGHTDRVLCLSYSPDGQSLLSGSSDKSLRLWTPASGTSQLINAHSDQVTSCEFSKDGQSFVSAGYDARIFVYATKSLARRGLSPHGDAVKALAYSEDSTQLSSASDDGTLRFWDLATSTFERARVDNARWPQLSLTAGKLPLISAPHGGRARAWSSAGTFSESPVGVQVRSATTLPAAAPKKALLGLEDGRVAFWNLDNEVEVLGDLGAPVTHLVSQAGTSVVALGNSNGGVYRFDWRSRDLKKLTEHDQRLETLALSSDARFIASGGWDKTVRVHDSETQTARVLKGHTNVVSVLRFSPGGLELASASWDKSIRLWTLNGPLHNQRRLLGRHRGGAHTARFSKSGNWVASGGHDNLVQIFDLDTKQQLELHGHTDHVYRVAFAPDGRSVASSSDDQTVRVWDLPEQPWPSRSDSVSSPVPSTILSGHEADVEELAFSPDGKRLISASEDQTARLWDLETQKAKVLYHDHDVTQVVFNTEGTRLATSSRAGEVRLFRSDGQALEVYREHGAEVQGLAFSPNGRWLASADIGGRLTVREVSGARSTQLDGLSGARQIVFSPNGKWLGVAGYPSQLWLCPFAKEQLDRDACRDLDSYRSVAHAIAFSPDGRQLASAGGDGELYLWNVDSPEYRTYRGHLSPVFDVQFSPNGRWLLSAASDETVRLWPRIGPSSPGRLSPILQSLTEETTQSLASAP